MLCSKCGKEVADGNAFCIYCGSRLSAAGKISAPSASAYVSLQMPEPGRAEDKVQTDKIRTRSKSFGKKVIFAAVLAVLLLIGTLVGINMYNSPSSQMNRAIKARDMELAYDIFDDNFLPAELSDKSVELLKTAATEIHDGYLAGSIDYEDAIESLGYIRQFECESVREILTAAQTGVQTQHRILDLLDTAESYVDSGDYTAAISAYEDILTLDNANSDAAKGLEQVKKIQIDSLLEKAGDYAIQKAYEDAIFTYDEVLFLDPSNAVAEHGREEAKDALRTDVLEEMENYAAKGDFEAARNTVMLAQEYIFGDDPELTAALESLHDREIQKLVDNAYTATEGGDWDGALELLDTYERQYPNEKILQDARADIVERMPITLKNLTMVSSKSIEILTSVVNDRWGNIYDGAVKYIASYDAYCLYNLNKAYTTFTGVVFVPTNATNGKNMSFAIYLDEELAYYVDNITEETAPISFEIEVTGATTMRIVTDNIGSYNTGDLYFANTSFAKVEG